MNAKGLLAVFTLTALGCGNEDASVGRGPGAQDPDTQTQYAEQENELTNGETDYYHCFVAGKCSAPALSASTTCRSGRDYQISLNERTSDVVVLSFHGGLIEPLSSELARAVSDQFGWSTYDFSAHGTSACLGSLSDFDRLHITATNFDETTAVLLLSRHKKAVAIHGYSPSRGNNRGTLCVGGHNTAQVQAFIAAVQQNKARFTLYGLQAVDAANASTVKGADCSSLGGTARENLVNRTANTAGGLQLESSNEIKADLLNLDTRYDGLRSIFYGALSSAMSR